MKQNELMNIIYEKLKNTGFGNCLKNSYCQLRIIGLFYNSFIYTNKLKDKDKTFNVDQILFAIDNSVNFLIKVKDNSYSSDKHKINTLVNIIQRNLIWNTSNVDDVYNNELDGIGDVEF